MQAFIICCVGCKIKQFLLGMPSLIKLCLMWFQPYWKYGNMFKMLTQQLQQLVHTQKHINSCFYTTTICIVVKFYKHYMIWNIHVTYWLHFDLLWTVHFSGLYCMKRQINQISITLSKPFSSSLLPRTSPMPARAITGFSPMGSATKSLCFWDVDDMAAFVGGQSSQTTEL